MCRTNSHFNHKNNSHHYEIGLLLTAFFNILIVGLVVCQKRTLIALLYFTSFAKFILMHAEPQRLG